MMKSRVAHGLLLGVLVALLAGCGLFDFEEREPWRAQAEAACYARHLVHLSTLIQETSAVEGKGTCGLDRPLKVAALADGSIQIGGRPVIMSCPMTAALERWVKDSVMPAAYERFGVPVVEIKTFGTYNCRSRNSVPGARLSEHAFANAFDFAGVVLANGYSVSVKRGWRGDPADRAFLREILVGACGPFTTVLGPGSDGHHEDHLHLDLARHNAKGTYRYCRPKIDAPPPAAAPSPLMVGPATETPVASAAPASLRPAAPTDGSIDLPAAPAAAQPPGCPAGYVCTPAAASIPDPVGLPPLGWQKGPDGVDAEDGTITGSIGYSDD